jgi:hypothetical protein
MATGYNRVYNTVLSGNEAQSSLSGNDVRMLEFDAALKRRPAVVLAAGNNELSVEDWMQASIDTLLLNPAVAGEVSLGTDSATQAAAYVSLFDLRSTNEQRLLRMAISVVPPAAGVVELKNNSAGPTSAHVQVQLDGGAAAATQTLFDQAIAPGGVSAGDQAGLERLVVVSASNLNSGAEVVQFNVLSGSL